MRYTFMRSRTTMSGAAICSETEPRSFGGLLRRPPFPDVTGNADDDFGSLLHVTGHDFGRRAIGQSQAKRHRFRFAVGADNPDAAARDRACARPSAARHR